jgi:hypothetical protein
MACIKLDDFINQQVGHTESEDHGKGPGKGGKPSDGGRPDGGDVKCASYHEVQAGEGLYEIGAQYNRTPQQMLDANPSVRDNNMWVYVGQKVCVP